MEKDLLMENQYFKDFKFITRDFLNFRARVIPLCAAENVMSEFSKLPLLSSTQEKYVMGGLLNYDEDNFIGGELIYPYYNIINKQCTNLFSSTYADSRTFTGMNSITTVLMSLTKTGDTILISEPDSGGHASIPDICHRLGLSTKSLPYDYEKLDFDYEAINDLIASSEFKLVLFSLSDIVNIPKLNKIENTKNVPIIYDATQTLGLIAGNSVVNPLSSISADKPFILMGATHKTLPGPSASLIMTNNKILANQLEKSINPTYLRNTQMHQKLSLLFTLIETEVFGTEYARQIIDSAQYLAKALNNKGFEVLNERNGFTETHQIFFKCTLQEMENFYQNCTLCDISLNYKTKKIFRMSGIRIGTQEIARYNWDKADLDSLADFLYYLMITPTIEVINNPKIDDNIEKLRNKKKVEYTFDQTAYKEVFKKLDLWIE